MGKPFPHPFPGRLAQGHRDFLTERMPVERDSAVDVPDYAR